MRILVCDDERPIVRLLQLNLEREGHAVACAYDGGEAIRCLEREPFERAILDLVMPIRDGLEVLHWIRDHDTYRSMPVAILSEQAKVMRERTDLPLHPDLWAEKGSDLGWLRDWLSD